jgi:hypothetical protein
MNDDPSIWEEALPQPTNDQLAQLSRLAIFAKVAADRIEFYEQAKAEAIKEYEQLIRHALPDAMAEVGMTEFTTADGLSVKVLDKCSGSLPKDEAKRSEALAWLEQVAPNLIKAQVVAEFQKGQDNIRGHLCEELRGLGVAYQDRRDVHASTLKAFARERMRKGEEVPLEKLGLYARREAEVKR